MVDSVELIVVDQLHQVRKFHRYNTRILQKYLHSSYEIHNVRNMRQYIVAKQQISFTPFRSQF